MNRTWLTVLVALTCAGGCLTDRVEADTKVRPCPDPGYRQMGMYSGGLAWIDYYMVKQGLGDKFPDKANWWAGLKTERQRRPASPDIYILYFDLKGGATLEQAKQRVDAWLKSEPDAPTHPELIPAVCLDEENQPHRHFRILNELALYIRGTYGIPVFQWFTDPMGPGVDLTADGWIFDAYFREYPRFRRHLMSFVAHGKPAIAVLWASDPAWRGYAAGRFANATALFNNVEHQFRSCLEFNVSTAVFAVAGPGSNGSINWWRGVDTPDGKQLRNWVRHKQAQMHAFKPGDLPLASANFSMRAVHAVSVGGDPDAPSVYREDFGGTGWLHHADITGFLDLKLSSRPAAEPGFLLLKTRSDRPVEVTLTYRFESYFPLARVEVKLAGAAPAAANAVNEIAISRDGEQWLLKADQQGHDAIQTFSLEADDQFLQNSRTVFVRVAVRNDAEAADVPANVLDRLEVRCTHKPPPAGAAATFYQNLSGDLFYHDDFSTVRWQHLGQLRAAHPTHGGYTGSGFWVGMVGGYPTSTGLVQRFTAPREMKALTVTVHGRVNTRDLGGHVDLGVAPRGGKVQWRASTDQQEGGVHDTLSLQLPPEALPELRDFDVHIILRSTSGIESGEKACASIEDLSIRAR